MKGVCDVDARDIHALQQMFSAAIKHGHTPRGLMGFLSPGR
jgi:hypothetical protein